MMANLSIDLYAANIKDETAPCVTLELIWVITYLHIILWKLPVLKKKKQRKKENILGVNTNSTVHIMVLTEYISISALFGASTNQPK